MARDVRFGVEARAELKKGVDLIANAVKTTLGPRGRNVVYGYHYGYPVVTKDGVTVARQADSKDSLQQLGVLLVRQVAQKTADDAGDGTTTASLLAQAIFTEGLKCLSSGANPVLIKRGIDKAVEEVIKFIDEKSIKVKGASDILSVASLSANNDGEIAAVIGEAVGKVGEEGVITIEDNYQDSRTYVENVEGMQLSEGFVSPWFMTDPAKMEAQYREPKILLVDGEIDHIRPLMKIIQDVIGTSGKPLVIIAHNFVSSALQTLVMNRAKENVPILCCKAPNFGVNRSEGLMDIAAAIGAKVAVSMGSIPLEKVTIEDLGEAELVKATKTSTTIINGRGKQADIAARIAQINYGIEKAESDYEKEKLQERLAKLTSGVAVIKVGAATEVELKEKKMRVEDSLHATRAALEEGIVAGGGSIYLAASRSNIFKSPGKDESGELAVGYRIVREVLRAPIKQLAYNSGMDGSEVIANIPADKENYGYDFLNNQYGDMFSMGIVDPAKVVKLALKNAASVAGMLLTTEVTIHEEEEDEVKRTHKPR